VGDGTYTATITSTTAETVTVTAAISGTDVTNTANVSFTATAATVGNSTLTASPTSVAADGTNSMMTLQAKDTNGNNLSTGGLTVTMSESGSATLSGVTDVGDGTYTATITSTTAETVTVTAAISGTDVTNTATVTFTATPPMTAGGITYSTVTIVDQTWTAENMRHDPDPSVGTYVTTYKGSGGDTNDNDGYYYNWEAANNVCPDGWGLPSDANWKTLETNLGMATDKLDTTGWRATSAGTQLVGGSSGFDAKLAGSGGSSRGTYGYFWTSTAKSTSDGWRRIITNNPQLERSGGSKASTYSVRCLKD
jgi:uncharacterized protein (TIGR02145 family)